VIRCFGGILLLVRIPELRGFAGHWQCRRERARRIAQWWLRELLARVNRPIGRSQRSFSFSDILFQQCRYCGVARVGHFQSRRPDVMTTRPHGDFSSFPSTHNPKTGSERTLLRLPRDSFVCNASQARTYVSLKRRILAGLDRSARPAPRSGPARGWYERVGFVPGYREPSPYRRSPSKCGRERHGFPRGGRTAYCRCSIRGREITQTALVAVCKAFWTAAARSGRAEIPAFLSVSMAASQFRRCSTCVPVGSPFLSWQHQRTGH
jgi:hypothetical protein